MEQNRKVKFMKKKLSLILCLCFMALGLAACGTDPTTVDYFGMTYDELQSSMEQEVSALVGLTDDNRTYIQSYGSDTAMSWDEATSDVGAYQGLGEFNITKAQKTLTVDQYVEYQNREVIVSYIYTYNYETEQPELTDASADKVYTLGEKMEKAALNTLMGMGTVFVVLILISLLISCFTFIPKIQAVFSKKPKEEAKKEPAVDKAIAQIVENEELSDDLELVAVISAAIAASEGAASTDGFVVRSIRRASKWQRA